VVLQAGQEEKVSNFCRRTLRLSWQFSCLEEICFESQDYSLSKKTIFSNRVLAQIHAVESLFVWVAAGNSASNPGTVVDAHYGAPGLHLLVFARTLICF
jgi:hypothetical protein